MNRIAICKELIKVANELDKFGDYENANELTKLAQNFFKQFGKELAGNLVSDVVKQNEQYLPDAVKNTPSMQKLLNPSGTQSAEDINKQVADAEMSQQKKKFFDIANTAYLGTGTWNFKKLTDTDQNFRGITTFEQLIGKLVNLSKTAATPNREQYQKYLTNLTPLWHQYMNLGK